MAKLFLTTLLVLSLILPTTAQQGGRRVCRKAKTSARSLDNQPPIIKSLITSSATITIPCPRWVEGSYSVGKLRLGVATEASDPDGDSLSYQYFVTGGQIIGKGAKVDWDLTGVKSGAYEVKVQVSDPHGAIVSESSGVSVLSPIHCPAPCASISVSCPDDVEEKKAITFTANVSGGEPTVKPTYNWTVSAGTIINGQGTESIEVDTTGLTEQVVTATLEVGGYPAECGSKASCQVRIRKKK